MKDLKERTWISFRVKPAEYQQIHALFKQSACRKLSDYARKVLLEKPVVVYHRDRSAEEFLGIAAGIARSLNGIGNNFNQAVHKLHILRTDQQFRNWYTTWSLGRLTLENKIEEVRKILLQWSPK